MRYSRKTGNTGMRSVIFLVVAALLLQFVLAGCGRDTEVADGAEGKENPAPTVVAAEQTEAPEQTEPQDAEAGTDEETAEAAEDEADGGEASADPTEEVLPYITEEERKILQDELMMLSKQIPGNEKLKVPEDELKRMAENIDAALKVWNQNSALLQSSGKEGQKDAADIVRKYLDARTFYYEALDRLNALEGEAAADLSFLEEEDGKMLADGREQLMEIVSNRLTQEYYFVMQGLCSNVMAESFDQCETKEADRFLMSMEERQNLLDHLVGFPELMDLYSEIKSSDEIKSLRSLMAAGLDGSTRTGSQLVSLNQRWEELSDKVYAYFNINEEAGQPLVTVLYKDLMPELEALQEELNGSIPNVLPEMVVEGANSQEELRADLGKIQEDQESLKADLEGKDRTNAILVYIVLGIASVSLIMAIVATICGSRKPSIPKGVTIATGEQAEALRMRTEQLHQSAQSFEQKQGVLDQQTKDLTAEMKELKKLKFALEDASARIRELEKRQVSQTHNPTETVSVKKRTAIDTLTLRYMNIGTAASILVPDPNGEYILYDDMTVSIKCGELNSLQEWSDTGLLYMFNVSIGGKEYTGKQAAGQTGFYQIARVLRPAAVTQYGGGSYGLVEPGCLEMRSM